MGHGSTAAAAGHTGRGTTLILLASIGFGLNPLFARWAYQGGLTAETALLYRFIIPALLITPLLRGARRHPGTVTKALFLGIFVSLGTITYFQAIAVVPVATAALVYFTHPLFTVLLGWMFFSVPLTRRSGVTAVLVVIAAAIILSPDSLSAAQLSALLISFLMPVSFATLLLGFEHWLTDLSLGQRTAVTLWGQVLVIVPIALFFPVGAIFPDNTIGWLGVTGLATLSSLLPQLLLAAGVLISGAARASILGSSELVTSLLVGWLLLAEPVRGQEVAGAAFLILAIFLSHSSASIERFLPTKPS